MNYTLNVALEVNAVLGESPVWDNRKQVLLWVDSIGKKVGIFDPKTGSNKFYGVGQSIGSVMLTERDNEVVVGLVDGVYVLDLKTSSLTFKVNPEEGTVGNRMNDGKVDAKGRIWIGSMSVADDGVEGFDTSYRCKLYSIDTNYMSEAKDPQVKLANGLAWTQDNKTMYFIDSPTRTVYRYDFDLEKGEIANRTVCIKIPEEFGICDGMDIDIDGNLWIAHWQGWCVGKWDPTTGKLLGKIEVPVCRVASCAFGGKDYDELYIVTASVNSEKDEKEQPQAGSIFVARDLNTRGLPFNRFREN